MSRKKKKKVKLKIGRILVALLCLIIAIVIVYKLLIGAKNILVNKQYYISSDNPIVKLYSYEEEKLKEEKDISRGVKVNSNDKSINVDNTDYIKIKYDNEEYFINKNNLTEDKNNIVLEKERYVRTSVTIYKDSENPYIESFVKKGNKLDIVGYDKLNSDGTVNMYKIQYNDIEGYVYAKYLVATEEESKAVYNENSTYDTHKDRKYSRELYGGKASTLDYYPYEKPEFEDNKLLTEAYAIYLNSSVVSSVDDYINLAKDTGINAMVVDIKDGVLAYKSEVAREYSPTAYENALGSMADYALAIKKIKDAGFYAIGRIVVFNDEHYGKDHPEDNISTNVSYRKWPSAYSRGAWEYNVMLAREAVKEMGFNEIQFDYVRFPEDAYRMSTSGSTDFKNKYNEEKAEAVQNFIIYAADQIHNVGAYFSVDVFGECSSTYVTAYGQYWPAISNIVDVISSMPYTDHFDTNPVRWTNPYQTLYDWAKLSVARQKEIPTPAVARTWITAYDTPHWNPTVVYDASKIKDQIKGLEDAGLKGGVMTWNVRSSTYKYNQIKSAFPVK